MDDGYLWLEDLFDKAEMHFKGTITKKRPKHSYSETEYTSMFRPLTYSSGENDFFSLKKNIERTLGERDTADPAVYYVCKFSQALENPMRKLFNRTSGYIGKYIDEDLVDRVSCP